jgi:E3 ubiquitin-protein ligase HECTD1
MFTQDDEDGHLVVLNIIEEIMSKTQEEFLDHFARLGVFSKVQALMNNGANLDADVDVIKQEDSLKTGGSSVMLESSSSSGSNKPPETLDDAKEILPGKSYHWRDWSICRGRDCSYIWSDSAALELSNGEEKNS